MLQVRCQVPPRGLAAARQHAGDYSAKPQVERPVRVINRIAKYRENLGKFWGKVGQREKSGIDLFDDFAIGFGLVADALPFGIVAKGLPVGSGGFAARMR